MSTQKEFYKQLYPEQYSDSKTIKAAKLDRDFFSYLLETLTNEGREKDFEVFCRKLAEYEICPNLLPQTGPTGGGDSKVDTETYPISQKLTYGWFYGNPEVAMKERWAFAISAKKDWQTKFKSDIKKIFDINIEMQRNYSKVFFMTNQFVSDKNRAKLEDELRGQYGFDVRILDKNWILEKTISNKRVKLVIDAFGLSEMLDEEIQIGDNDFKRKKELDEINEKLQDISVLTTGEIIYLNQRSIVLAREIEVTKETILGYFDRYRRMLEMIENKVEYIEYLYIFSWTIYWWYEDNNLFYENYKKFEEKVLDSNSIEYLKKLTNLYINLVSLKINEKITFDISEHTNKICEKHKSFIDDKTMPNMAFQANLNYQSIRFFLGDDKNDIVNEYINIISHAQGRLDIDIESINKIVNDLPIFKDSEQYDILFELLLKEMGELSQNVAAAKLLIIRGDKLAESTPYEALKFYSRSLHMLINHKSKDTLISLLTKMAFVLEKVGLLWAARNIYMYVFCSCSKQYLDEAECHPSVIYAAHRLKMIELKFGRILYSIEFDSLEDIFHSIYYKKIELEDDNYDAILAILLLSTKFTKLNKLNKLNGYLENKGLFFSSVITKYLFGHYDECLLKEVQNNYDIYEERVKFMNAQPIKSELAQEPWFGFEDSFILKSKILGCSISIISPNDALSLEFASTILASLESFYSTGLYKGIVSVTSELTIELEKRESLEKNFFCKLIDEFKNIYKITFTDFYTENFLESQKEISDFLTDVLAIITSRLFPFKEFLENIEEMINKENALMCSQIFANSIFLGLNTFGFSTFAYNEITSECETINLIREEPINFLTTDIVKPNDNLTLQNKLEVIYDKPDNKSMFSNIKQEDIEIKSIINFNLWNRAKWKGVMYITGGTVSIIPIFSIIFLEEQGNKIFEQWIDIIGNNDTKDQINFVIIKEIDRKNPFYYRIVIGSDPTKDISSSDSKIINNLFRIHNMTPKIDTNLKVFENELKKYKKFYICPSVWSKENSSPKLNEKLKIEKNISSIKICNAWEIKKDDILSSAGILPNDNPIIPPYVNNPPIIELLQLKRNFIR